MRVCIYTQLLIQYSHWLGRGGGEGGGEKLIMSNTHNIMYTLLVRKGVSSSTHGSNSRYLFSGLPPLPPSTERGIFLYLRLWTNRYLV